MRKLLLSLLVLTAISGLAACSDTPELKSPCVDIKDGPCERRSPKNNVG
jgi:hypothetical protein